MRGMQVRYRYRLDPPPGQRMMLAKAFGCARVVFNDGLRLREQARLGGEPFISDGDLEKAVITRAKQTPERAWLGEVPNVTLQQAVRDLNQAYRNFFNSLKGKRKGRRIGAPRFRSKRGTQSVRFTRNCFVVRANGRLYATKVGEIPVIWSRPLPSAPSSVTIILDTAGRYWASFVVEVQKEPLTGGVEDVGIDLGLDDFAVLSDGTKVSAPKFLRRKARKLKRLQQALSRKEKGSKNKKKAVREVARAHARVADTRRDWQHKLSTRIVRENQAVYVEDLCVAGLGRTRMARSVYDAGWARFVSMLEYKAAMYGRVFQKIDRFAPTSQTCSECGA
jgi:putative transposase